MFDESSGQINRENNEQNPQQRLDDVMQRGTLTGFDQGDPAGVDFAEVLLVLQAAAAVGEIFLIERVLFQRIERGLGAGLGVLAARRGAGLGESLGLLFGGLSTLFVLLDLSRELGVASG